MIDKDKIYLAALLHDIGKFIERAKDTTWQDEAYKYVRNKEASKGYAHRRYSTLFVEKNLAEKDFAKGLAGSIQELILHHHNDNPKEVDNYLSINERGVIQKIIRMADDLASSERDKEESLKPQDYYLANLESPFNDIRIKNEAAYEQIIKKKGYLPTTILSIEQDGQFPIYEYSASANQYPQIVNAFLEEITEIESENALLALMEKYLQHVPAQTPTEFDGKQNLYKPDLNLYDHSRTVAAIAVVLFEEYLNGAYKSKDNEICSKNYQDKLSNPAILICGNVNGIQDFIFDVKSKRAAKSLKGRSYFVQFVTEVVSKYIIDQFGLKKANVLYNGGGNFFILAPNYRKNYLEEIQKKVAENFIDTKLYLSLGTTEVSFNDFKSFGNAFDKAVQASNQAKKQKYKNLDVGKVFESFPQILKGEGKYDVLAEELQIAANYYIGLDYPEDVNRPEWEKIFRKFGYQVTLQPHVQMETKKLGIVFNKLEFSQEYESFKLAVKDLPNWTFEKISEFENIVKEKELTKELYDIEKDEIPTNRNPLKIIPFKRLAQYAFFETGTEKLGVLKMDIDNLGKIFKEGLGSRATIGRVAALSRSFKWFFEGYMNRLLQSDDFKDRVYPIFSGGDDFFVVGAWNRIFEFATKVREDFIKFVCEHPGITLSASLLVIDESYPIAQIARLAEERLEDAKNRRDVKTNSKIKNAISIFDTVLSWDDLDTAKELKKNIVQIIRLTKGNRAIINKILKSSSGFAAIQKEALFNKVIKTYKVWRLNYYLRDLVNYGKKENKEKVEVLVEKIVTQYEKLFFEAFLGNKTSIQIFPVAARWAELETRNYIGDK